MAEPRWTPGPWFFHRDELMHERHPMGSYDLIGVLDSEDTGNPWEVDEANRRLIAAAPKLYDILDQIAKSGMLDSVLQEFADAALSEARGETND